MYKYVVLFCLVAVSFSCKTPKKQEIKTQEIINTLKEVREIEKEADKKATQLLFTAYGDAQFGMTREEAMKTEIAKDAHILSDGSIYLDYKQRKIGSTSYSIIEFLFYENYLFQVNFEGSPIKDSEYNTTLKKEFEELKDIISVNYGEPEYLKFPKKEELGSESVCACAWRYTTKLISITIKKSSLQGNCEIDMYISYLPALDAIEKGTKINREDMLKENAKKF